MKPAEILHLEDKLVDNVLTTWKAGGVVAIPTETVYGLAADATNGEAVARIYQLKSRPQFNPLIVHVANIEIAERYAEWNERAEVLAWEFWPGPLTLVLPRKKLVIASEAKQSRATMADAQSGLPRRSAPRNDSISDLVTAGGDTIAIRCPQHPIAHQLLNAFNGGIAAPSANRSGRVSPTTAQHVRDEFGDTIPIVDGGASQVGLESTVVDLTTDITTILRPGSVTREMLQVELRRKWDRRAEVAVAGQDSEIKSPGQLESHYAPSIPVRLNATYVNENEALLAFGKPITGAAATLNLSSGSNLIEAAANLFAMLRQLDHPTHTRIAVMPIPEEGVGVAINDRLKRAAA